MRALSEGLWVHEDGMRLLGTHLPLRMTVVRLADGGLWVHSPTALDDALREEVEALGPVSHLVAASNGHNLWLQEWIAAFGNARVWVSSAIPEKCKLSTYRQLEGDSPWPGELDMQAIGGAPFFDETAFLHRPSRSLIVTDLVQNHRGDDSTGLEALIKRWILKPIGFRDICLAPPIRRGWVVKDRGALLASLATIAQWDFERIVVAHGEVVEGDARSLFKGLCEWVER